jgi:hypothetical protein
MHLPDTKFLQALVPVANLGFSGGGGLGRRGRVLEGVPPPAGGPGTWPRKNFLHIDVENMHFDAMFRQYLFISSLFILKQKCQLIFLSQVSAFMKLTAFLE